MGKRRKTRSSTSEATTIILEPPEPSSIERITKCPDACSVLFRVGGKACYRVAKPVLSEVSWFKDFFSQEQEQSTYYLPDDEPFSLRILFLILHHRPQLLPVTLLASELVDLASVCDRYSVSDIVLPHVEAQKWIENLWEDGKPCGEDWIVWNRILRGFYHIEERCKKLVIVLDVMAANMRTDGQEWIFELDSGHRYVGERDYAARVSKGLSCKYTQYLECPSNTEIMAKT
jgi:hypothetical protein